MASKYRPSLADLAIGFLCLLRLLALWVFLFLPVGVFVMFRKALKSKTILANAAVIVAALSGLVPVLGPFLAPTVAAKALAALAAANIVLRTVTKVPLSEK